MQKIVYVNGTPFAKVDVSEHRHKISACYRRMNDGTPINVREYPVAPPANENESNGMMYLDELMPHALDNIFQL